MASGWLWVTVAVLVCATVIRLLRKRPIDRGEVSERWLADHRASDPGNAVY